MKTLPLFLLFGCCLPLLASSGLNIYFVDVDGGAATLVVTPSGQSLLADAGWPDPDGRSARRIYEVATREAGLKKIDYFIGTHFHRGHVGGLEALAKMIRIERFFDHGQSVETGGREPAAHGKLSTGDPG